MEHEHETRPPESREAAWEPFIMLDEWHKKSSEKKKERPRGKKKPEVLLIRGGEEEEGLQGQLSGFPFPNVPNVPNVPLQ